jgi:VWFA-related protein
MHSRISSAARLAGILLLSEALLAQQPSFKSGVELVQADVVVVDAGGRHVRGLKAADFSVWDRGKPQTVATFEEVSHERPPAAPAAADPARPVRLDVGSNRTARASRLAVMVVDDLHIYKGRTERARKIARSVVNDLGADASMAVLFTSRERNTQVTEDRSVLLAAIDRIQGRQSVRRPHQAVDAQTAPGLDPEMSTENMLAAIDKVQDTDLQQFVENLAQYKTLQDAARLLGTGDARRKAFVLISEGIAKDLSGIFGAMSSPGDLPTGGVAYATTNNPAATTVLAPTRYHDASLIEMMESMRRSNVVTYAQAQDGLTIMAEATGGLAVTDTDDFTSGLRRIIADLDHYYLLGFYPADPRGKGYRPLEVSVRNHPDWKVRSRRGYRPGPSRPPANTDPLVELSAGVLPKPDLPMRIFAAVFPGDRKVARVAAAIEITAPAKTLLGPDARLHDEVSYGVLVIDEKKAKVTSLTRRAARVVLRPRASGPEMPADVSYQIPMATAREIGIVLK